MQAPGIQSKALARIKDSLAEKLAFLFCKHLSDSMLWQILVGIILFIPKSHLSAVN